MLPIPSPNWCSRLRRQPAERWATFWFLRTVDSNKTVNTRIKATSCVLRTIQCTQVSKYVGVHSWEVLLLLHIEFDSYKSRDIITWRRKCERAVTMWFCAAVKSSALNGIISCWHWPVKSTELLPCGYKQTASCWHLPVEGTLYQFRAGLVCFQWLAASLKTTQSCM